MNDFLLINFKIASLFDILNLSRRDGEAVTCLAGKAGAAVCPSTVSPNLIKFGLEVRDPVVLSFLARW